MPSLEASSSTASNEVHPAASASRTPAMNAGRAAGNTRRRINRRGGRRKTAAASRSFGCASLTPTNVCKVTGTTIALISTTSFSTSPMPKNTMNNGIHASVGICESPAKVGKIKRSRRRLNPSAAPSNAPAETPASRPQNKRCKLIHRWPHNSPCDNSTALFHTSEGAGRICSLIHSLRAASHHRANRPSGSSHGNRRWFRLGQVRRLFSGGAGSGRLSKDWRAMGDLRCRVGSRSLAALAKNKKL